MSTEIVEEIGEAAVRELDARVRHHITKLPPAIGRSGAAQRQAIGPGQGRNVAQPPQQASRDHFEASLRRNGKARLRVPSNLVITDRVIVALLPLLNMEAVEEIGAGAIQELDDRAGDCDYEELLECDTDDDLPCLHAALAYQLAARPHVATVGLSVVKQRRCPL